MDKNSLFRNKLGRIVISGVKVVMPLVKLKHMAPILFYIG
jgi:hypothetical protein